MIKNEYGRIVVFGGTRTQTVNGFRTNAVYAGAKTALCSFVKSVAAEYGKYNITCNGILPGFVETEYITQETKELLKTKMPRKELISPKNIAETIFFVTKCRSINGALINIDEGWMP
jgi:NAD(P)-dependent dehydrogenase (short-subunit alcohol dehydrogenase family)